MSYTPPAGDAAAASWVGAPAYTPPSGDSADISWADTAVVEGSVAATIATLLVSGHLVGLVGLPVEAVVSANIATLVVSGGATVGVGQNATLAANIAFGRVAGAMTALHPRYEVRGEVRLSGVLVNRTVRCYARGTGALHGQADTVAGKYRVPAGFTAAEVYTLAIDLSGGATDWIPPTANRLVPVLADDTL